MRIWGLLGFPFAGPDPRYFLAGPPKVSRPLVFGPDGGQSSFPPPQIFGGGTGGKREKEIWPRAPWPVALCPRERFWGPRPSGKAGAPWGPPLSPRAPRLTLLDRGGGEKGPRGGAEPRPGVPFFPFRGARGSTPGGPPLGKKPSGPPRKKRSSGGKKGKSPPKNRGPGRPQKRGSPLKKV